MKAMMLGTKEASHERAGGSATATWPVVALPVCRALESLDRGGFVPLFAADRAGDLVAVVFLDCGITRRRTSFTNASSVGGIVFLLRGSAHVWLLGATDEEYRRRRAVVEVARLLHSEPG